VHSSGAPNQEFFIVARFHAHEGQEEAAAVTLRLEVHDTMLEDSGCVSIQAFRSTRDPRLFFIESRWVDEAAFESHIRKPHNLRFAESIGAMIDDELQPVRLRPI